MIRPRRAGRSKVMERAYSKDTVQLIQRNDVFVSYDLKPGSADV